MAGSRPSLGPRPHQGSQQQPPAPQMQQFHQTPAYPSQPYPQQYTPQGSHYPPPPQAPLQAPPHGNMPYPYGVTPPPGYQSYQPGYHHQQSAQAPPPAHSHGSQHASHGHSQHTHGSAPPPPSMPHAHATTQAPYGYGQHQSNASPSPSAPWAPVLDDAYAPSSQQAQQAQPVSYGQPPAPPGHQGAAPAVPAFGGGPAAGYVQPANAPAAVYGAAAGAGPRSVFTPTGRKKALLIGINYSGKERLSGCINDVRCMQYLLSTRFGFPVESTTVLTDKPARIQGAIADLPTRRNILNAMHQLVAGAQPGDSLFFHFSGHGGQVKDTSGDEDDGLDETLIPMDWRKAGHIVDDECYDIMVRPLPAGVRLTAVLDACHSGTGLDLPYQHDVKYTGSGMTVAGAGSSSKASFTSGLAQVAGALATGKPSAAVNPLFKIVAGQVSSKKKKRVTVPKPNWNAGEVLLFAGCTDKQTSADTAKLSGGRTVTGAMTYALIESIEHSSVGDWQNYSYKKLLHTMRQKLLAARMSQTPQFSSSHPFDLDTRFVL